MTQTLEAASLLADFRTRRHNGSLDAEQVEREARRAADLIIALIGSGAVTCVTRCATRNRGGRESGSRAPASNFILALIERLNDSSTQRPANSTTEPSRK